MTRAQSTPFMRPRLEPEGRARAYSSESTSRGSRPFRPATTGGEDLSEIDWQAHEAEASSAVAAAASTDDIEDVRVRFLGRKSDLAQALRGVRDRDTGMLLNGIRQRLEAAVEARERTLADDELDRRLREEVVDVTLPG